MFELQLFSQQPADCLPAVEVRQTTPQNNKFSDSKNFKIENCFPARGYGRKFFKMINRKKAMMLYWSLTRMVVCISVTCGNEVVSFSLRGNSMIFLVQGECPSLPEGFNLTL